MKKFKKASILLMVAMLLGITGCGSTNANDHAKDFQGASFSSSDGSVIYFEENGDFAWYLSDEDHDDNYYSGEYELYFGEDAEDYIVNSIPEFGVTQDELDDLMERNEGDDFYQEANFCCMVLNNHAFKMDGEVMEMEEFKTYYMGFYADGTFDATNMQSANYHVFTRNE